MRPHAARLVTAEIVNQAYRLNLWAYSRAIGNDKQFVASGNIREWRLAANLEQSLTSEQSGF